MKSYSTFNQYRYLGVIFHEKMDFNIAAEVLGKSGGRALGEMISKIHNYKDVGFNTYEKLFHSCVVPILDYCSGVWGFKTYHSIEIVQNCALRYFLGLHRYAPAITLNSEVGWLAPTQRRWICMLKRWNRVIQMDDDRLTKKVFLWSYRNNSTWCSQVKEILYKLDLCSYFDFIRICDMNEVKSKLFKYYEDQWKSKTRSLPKLRTYVTFKQHRTLCNDEHNQTGTVFDGTI